MKRNLRLVVCHKLLVFLRSTTVYEAKLSIYLNGVAVARVSRCARRKGKVYLAGAPGVSRFACERDLSAYLSHMSTAK